MTRKRRRDDEDLLAMAFGAVPFIDELRAERDPEDDPENDLDDEDEEEDGDDDDEDDLEDDEVEF